MAQNFDLDEDARLPLAGDSDASPRNRGSIMTSQTDSSDLKERQVSSRKKREHTIALWWFEILAVCFSIACIAGMIALLGSIRGKPYKPWHALGTSITPNAILAILSTFSKSSLLLAVAEALGQLKWIYFQQRAHRLLDLQIFDEASRGPLGALKLIWTVRLRAIVAVTGAVIVILTMALDPFTQQILSFPTAPTILTNSTAYIGSANTFGQVFDYWEPVQDIVHYNLRLQESVALGVLSSDFNPTKFHCPTGDCHWPPFRTLGVCNKCVNVSTMLDTKCHPIPDYWGGPSRKKTCSYVFPVIDGIHIEENAPATVARWKVSNVWETHTLDGNVSSWNLNNKTVDFKAITASTMQNRVTALFKLPIIAVVEQIIWPADWHGKHHESVGTWQHVGQLMLPQATQCYLSWCEQSHNTTTVRRNILDDPSTSTAGLRFDLEWKAGDLTADGSPSESIHPLWPMDRPKPPEENLIVCKKNMDAENDIYWIEGVASSFLGETIQNTLKPFTNYIGNDFYWLREHSSTLAYRLVEGDLSVILDQLATSISTTVRSLNRTRTIHGNVTQPVTHVSVNWNWLIYSASLVILAVLFLLVSIGFSTEHNGTVWKTSILPLMFCSVDEHEQRDVDAGGLRELENTARQTQAQLMERNGDRSSLRFQLPRDGDG